MSLVKDQEQIHNLFHNEHQTVKGYDNINWVSMQDTTSTSTASIQFDSVAIQSRALLWEEAYLEIPIYWQASVLGQSTVVNGSTKIIDPYRFNASPIGTKCGPASLFSGIQVNLSSGTYMLNDQTSPFFTNQIRAKFEFTEDGLQAYGTESGFCPDYFPNAQLAGGPTAYGNVANSNSGTNPRPAPGSSLYGQAIQSQNINDNINKCNSVIFNQIAPNLLNPSSIVSNGNLPGNDTNANTNTWKFANNLANFANNFTNVNNYVLSNAPSTNYGGANTGLTTAGIYLIPLTSQNFTFSSNALLAIQKPAMIAVQLSNAGQVVTTGSSPNLVPTKYYIVDPGQGYGTDGSTPNVAISSGAPLEVTASTNGVALLPNTFTAELRAGATGYPCAVTAPTNTGSVFAPSVVSSVLYPVALFSAVPTAQTPIFTFQVESSLTGLSPIGVNANSKGGYSDLSCVNPFYNEGFNKRVSAWWNSTSVYQDSTATSNAIYKTDLLIRLKDIHDFFRTLNFPMENTRLQLTLFLNAPFNSSNTTQFAMQYGDNVMTNPPIFQIGGSPTGTLTQSVVTAGSCTMYIKAAEFKAADALTLYDGLSAAGGIKKELNFLEGEVTVLRLNSIDAQLNQQVMTTSTKVKRIWIFGLPVGSAQIFSSVNGSTGLGLSSAINVNQPYTAMTPTARCAQCVLLVNGAPWKSNVQRDDWEFFTELKEQLIGSGEDTTVASRYDYSQWLAGLGLFYVFDLGRRGIRASINDPLQINVQIQRKQDLKSTPAWQYYSNGLTTSASGNFTPVDWYCVIEKESNVVLNMGLANAAAAKTY
jgi:hypothetical protein